MSAEPAVSLDGVWLRYRLAKQRRLSVKEYALGWLSGQLRYEDLWALKGVSLELLPGERVGVVGPNGSGKSTLLKVVARVLPATRGRLLVKGRVAPVLAQGSGFDSEMTGAENVYLVGLLLGHTRREVEERFDEIVEFSGLGDFVRSPVRNYSAGMLARLSFSISTAWPLEIVLVDELLAVGDAAFLRRCRTRLEELWGRGATLVLVSHQPDAIRSHCSRCLWLEDGRILADGPPDDVLGAYADAVARASPRSR